MIKIEDVLEVANGSPCVRRKYGAIIDTQEGFQVTGYNARIGNCCNDVCVRERLNITHGFNTDAGAEIHAEQSVLLSMPRQARPGDIFYLAGIDRHGNPLDKYENASCYSCCRQLRFMGFDYVMLPFYGSWKPVSVAETMETWESLWEKD